jgi:catechol 2,3-dioxygenase-like lactoylglutathione lyase family enzyme
MRETSRCYPVCAMPRLLYVHPTLRARSVLALAEWYRDWLGFEIRFLYQDPPTHAVIRRDDVRLGIAPRDPDFGPASLYVFLEDVDAFYAECLSRGVRPNRALEVTDYRTKDFDLSYPDGNRICFGETIETAAKP